MFSFFFFSMKKRDVKTSKPSKESEKESESERNIFPQRLIHNYGFMPGGHGGREGTHKATALSSAAGK